MIELKAISKETCKYYYGDDLHDGHMCTLTKSGRGACYVNNAIEISDSENFPIFLFVCSTKSFQGDSGGPLVYDKYLIGVVNFAVPCGIGYPDAYASAAYYYHWIHHYID